jgi:MerR family mercuric resistance operon transcriptional regulator
MDGTGRIAIGGLSKHTGANIETIRYYERVGLLPAPTRSPGGYRLYGSDHLKRLNFIRRARALGFSIGEVRTLLRLADESKNLVVPRAGSLGSPSSHRDRHTVARQT